MLSNGVECCIFIPRTIFWGDTVILFIMGNEEDAAKLVLLYERYAQTLLKYAYSILGNKSDAEDCVAETFYTVANLLSEQPDKVNGVEDRKTGSFLIVITKHKAYNMLRRKQKIVEVELSEEVMPPTGDFEVLETVQLGELKQVLADSVKALDEKYKTPLMLRYYHDCSVTDISKIMGVSESHVSVLIYRAKSKVKEALKDAI